ncbi:hypothetical protein GYMLUDRAFT_75796 [Collybiopsis luxurians FD-317 M1]|uniref:Acyl-CoA dehydrogenase/oxidase N-terminal domain-containing protein n=1 Tax=Collybiopsis luxurians FD-317 M1 TaxID=944289 RepID=A0A0D0B298_9AGAR|nr:hypothetical protein GYMLUDRAFT_75796 [Collybiopsis luxurians FD-317 M1]
MGIETSASHEGSESSESSFTSAIIAIEELAKINPFVFVLCDVHSTLVNIVMRTYATEEQKEKWLPSLATEHLGSFCLSEPASGSDAFALQTKARNVGDDYVLQMRITISYEANIFWIFAHASNLIRVTSELTLLQIGPSKDYKGIICFFATKNMSIGTTKKEQKLGIRAFLRVH